MQPAIARRMRVDSERVTVHCGHHVLAFSRRGMIEPEDDGYYYNQTRFISRFGLTSESKDLNSVACVPVEPHATVSYLLLPSPAGVKAGPQGDPEPSGGEIVQKAIEVQINTYVGGGYHQDVHVTNHALADAKFALDFEFLADFADIEEVSQGSRKQTARIHRSFSATAPGRGELTFAYEHPDLNHKTRIRIEAPGQISDEGKAIRAILSLHPREIVLIKIDVAPVFLGESIEPWFGPSGELVGHKDVFALRRQWLAECAELETPVPAVQAAWDRAATDLWSLQSLNGKGEENFTPIAGIPKYTGLFGRDSLVAGIQSSLLNVSTLFGTLLSVGEWTATTVDDQYDAQPGKVLHQRQLSPLAILGKTPFIHYYGDYSAPAYYLIGAALHFAQTGDRQAFERIRGKVLATLEWIDHYADIDGDGFYEYQTRAGEKGIKNQGWKDSSQAILYEDGGYVRDPIATVEIQGLFYAAKQTLAGLFTALGEQDRAERLYGEAAELKKQFNERYWMPDLRFYGLALDPDDRLVKTIASNPGLCLACGIVDDDKAEAVVDRLMAPDMFSGWGVRTLSSDHPAYNPMSYHLGSVWPVANAHLCVGLKRYGFDEALHKVARGMFDAAGLFENGRLPEVFGGHPRDDQHLHPGIYPDACSPQTWSASAVIQICNALTGIAPLAPQSTLVVDPALPDWLPEVTVRNLCVGDKRVSIRLTRDSNGECDHEVLEGGHGLRIHRPIRGPRVRVDSRSRVSLRCWRPPDRKRRGTWRCGRGRSLRPPNRLLSR